MDNMRCDEEDRLERQQEKVVIKYKDERIKKLEKVAMQLFDMVHESDLIHNKIKANGLYDIIVKKQELSTK
jgi:hypothetical protein